MLAKSKAAIGLVAGILAGWVSPASGQIAAVVDDSGKRVVRRFGTIYQPMRTLKMRRTTAVFFMLLLLSQIE